MLLAKSATDLTLTFPRSHCDHCNIPITPVHNIPILSFVLLKGRCPHCDESISKLYPITELATAVGGLAVIFKFGFSYEAIAFSLLVSALIALSLIDLENKILPDQLTLPLIWAGLSTNLLLGYVPITEAVLGSMFGYLSLWAVFWLYKFFTSKDALGFGDFKLLAAVGAWFGVYALSWVIMIGALTGLAFSLYQILFKQHSYKEPIPFGPFISLGSLIYLFFHESLFQSLDFHL